MKIGIQLIVKKNNCNNTDSTSDLILFVYPKKIIIREKEYLNINLNFLSYYFHYFNINIEIIILQTRFNSFFKTFNKKIMRRLYNMIV